MQIAGVAADAGVGQDGEAIGEHIVVAARGGDEGQLPRGGGAARPEAGAASSDAIASAPARGWPLSLTLSPLRGARANGWLSSPRLTRAICPYPSIVS